VADVKQQIPPAVERYNGVTDKTSAMMQSITDMIGPATTDWKAGGRTTSSMATPGRTWR